MDSHSDDEGIEFYFLGSSSSGNAYIFQFNRPDFSQSILVEAGFTYKELVARAIKNGTRLSECRACLITHSHSDHAMGAKAVHDHGIPVYASKGTLEAINMTPYEARTLQEGTWKYIANGVAVLPFIVEHDAPEPMGFIICDTIQSIRILFINDSKTVKADLSGIAYDYVFIECNYHETPTHIAYNQAIKNNDIPLVRRYERIIKSHMSLYGCRKILNTLDLSSCRSIFLMHLSKDNAKGEWLKDIRDKVGSDHPEIPVFVCLKDGGLW